MKRNATVVTDLESSGDAFYVRMLARAVEKADPGIAVTRFRPAAMLTGDAPALWHVHWPESVATSRSPGRAAVDVLAFALSLRAARRTGTPIVWTAHNLEPHESHRGRAAERLMRSVVARLDGWISLSRAAVPLAIAKHPRLARLPQLVVPHGHFADVYPAAPDRAEARGVLGLPADPGVLLFFGNIRTYKNVPGLLRAFRSMPEERLLLVIAGAPYDRETRRAVEDAAAGDARIRLRLEHVPEADVPLLFGAADGVVLPADRILNSGSVLLALSFGLPVLAPDTPVLRELRDQVGHSAVRLFDAPIDGAALAGFLADLPRDRASIVRQVRLTHDWRRIGSATASFYRSLMADHSQPRRGA